VTGLIERAAGFLLVTEQPAAGPVTAAVPAEARAVVLGAVRDAPPVAAALALTLRAAEGVPAALVAVWRAGGDAEPASGAAAMRAASRLAARLSRRELPAAARGRLAWLHLPPEPDAAAAALRRAMSAVDGPVVTALAGARPAALEPLVDDHDLVVVASDPGAPLAAAALAGLGERGVSVLACRPLPRGPSRALALAGLVAPRLDPPLRAARTTAQPPR
jgi:hypothetical protein